MADTSFRMGIDIGGTFTDLVVAAADGRVFAFKAPSTPADPSVGVIDAIQGAARALGHETAGFLRGCEILVHGSTIATNTLLERKGARLGLLTTEGFRDSLEIRRGLRQDVWNHRAPFPAPLVPRLLRRGVVERVDAAGRVQVPLDEASVHAALDVFRAEGVEAIAICFLHAFRNPEHEQACRALIERAWPQVWVSCSSDVAPVLGEYERSATVAANAYIAPRTAPYLRALEERLTGLGLQRPLLIVQSNGGALQVGEIASRPVQMVLSGPAAGVGAIRHYGDDTGARNLVAIEVGGTSCDVTLMRDGVVQMTEQLDVDGNCIAIPSVEIHTIGAGGGTIGHVDAGGMLQAGPQGAGARPGPAAYGFGGERPTVTDAQLVLGRLAPGPYAGGAIALDLQRAVAAIDTHLARPLGLSVEQAAAGLIRLVEQNIQHAVERVSIERGYDIRDFTLIAAGGAGPLHGAAVGRALGCAAVYVPRLAGVFCAFGMCNADVRIDRLLGWYRRLADGTADDLERAYRGVEAQATDALHRQGFADADIVIERSLALRYTGQQWPVHIDCPGALDAATLRRDFQVAHQRLYGHFQENGEIEILTLKVAASGRLATRAAQAEARVTGAPPPPKARRPVWISPATGTVDTPVHDGAGLRPGHVIDGPAIVDEATTTLLVEDGQRLRVTAAGNYLIEPAARAEAAAGTGSDTHGGHGA
ncbi:MAG TPA: hydantoinase/oxoprolinase family protein [Quisquiliibacterium sp.]|nr:hydantoinase/oxoprolinase family protein [Quisquiliibacterium sp.]HQN11271.1 hydantoinase/oxoprolinase family protein [Quisquiliibacterium sp.]HQP67738.1 hydantoinase/oxoprolinase family protein [Quisquiliibacterium sp.]